MQNPNYIEKGDALEVFLQNEFTKDNTKLIIDELLTFYFAGS
jgi:hypothetical protein